MSGGTEVVSWLFLDLNSYFASVEQDRNPALRGRPVAVVPVMSESTCAIAASYEAKAYGIKTGTPIWEALKLCPDLKLVLARHDVYVEYHHRVLEEVERHLPIDKVWSIDELSCKLLGPEKEPEQATCIAQSIKEGLLQHVGPCVRCSVGLAPNRFLAKVASDMQKPDGLTVLRPCDLPGPLLSLSLRDLPGIGINMERRLNRAGIWTVEAFWNLAPKHARQIWKSVEGERFWHMLHGIEVPKAETEKRMVGHSRVLDPSLRHMTRARLVARRLTVKAASRLRRLNYYACCFSLSVRFVDGWRWRGDSSFAPARDNFAFLRCMDRLWREMHSEYRGQVGQRPLIKKISIHLSKLRAEQIWTPDLFDERTAQRATDRQHLEALSDMVDGLNKRYGAETVTINGDNWRITKNRGRICWDENCVQPYSGSRGILGISVCIFGLETLVFPNSKPN